MTPTGLLSDYHEGFLKDLEERRRSYSTLLAYGKDIEQLIEFAKSRGLIQAEQITNNLIEDFKSDLRQKDYTAKSISRKINSVKAFFRYLKNEGLIKANPATDIAHPKVESTPPRILTKLEYRALRDVVRYDDRMYAIVEVLLQTGIRISELASLKLTDLSSDYETITVDAIVEHERRQVPLNRSAAKAVEGYVKYRPKTSYPHLFVTKTGRPFLVRNIRAAIDRYFKIAGIKQAKVNDLRHTFIAEQLAAGTPLLFVSKLVGHKRLTTTEKYLKFLENRFDQNEIKLQEL